MPINMTISMPNVWRRVGIRKLPDPHTFHDAEWQLQKVKGPEIGICIAWEKTLSFLNVRAFWSEPGKLNYTEFCRGGEALIQAYQQVNNIRMRVHPDFLAAHEMITAVVPTNARIRLLFCVDTDHLDFAAFCEAEGRKGPLRLKLLTQVFDITSAEPGEIILDLGYVRKPDPLEGYIALDLGNACSTLAVHPGHHLDHHRIWIVDGETLCGCTDSDDPVPNGDLSSSARSAVRLDMIRSDWITRHPEAIAHPACIDWKIGEAALDSPTSEGVILGAKRLLAGRNFEEVMNIRVRPRPEGDTRVVREPVSVRNRLAGELLICRLFQRFRQISSCQLPALAVTYPTSYSRREIDQLRNVTRRSLVRQNAEEQRAENLATADARIKLMLDEASASAFFYLFRDILKSPPGLSRFRYLYPEGYNLLLYDCGGGTTDIGLVTAAVDPEAPGILRVSVGGRSGVRNFGGDNITETIFRILKGQIALRVQEARGGQPSIRFTSNNPLALVGELRTLSDRIDREVPTTYNRLRMNGDDRRNRDHTRALWDRAANIKHALSAASASGVPAFPQEEQWDDPLCQYLFTGLPASVHPTLRNRLQNIRIKREEIDPIIKPDIERTVRRCNQLIRRRLIQNDACKPQEVHRFILLGNGSLYPLIKQLLSEQLDVMFFDERLVFEPKELKAAVAKGAVLALATAEAGPDVRIEFDWSLSDRLPYDVGYMRLGRGGQTAWLYHEGECYEEIAARPPKQVMVLTAENENRARILQLVRRWPGDEEVEEYLTFDFEYGIDGTVSIEFDQTQEFRVFDSRNATGRLVNSGNEELYLHPVERGTL